MENKIDQTTIYVEKLQQLDVGVIGIRYAIGASDSNSPVGCAHFLEHVVCSTLMERLPGKITAQTKRDQTSYALFIPKGSLQQALTALSIESPLNKKVVEQERKVIQREIAQHQLNKRNKALEYLQALLFAGQGYGQSILGDEEQVSKITLDDLHASLAYYQCPRTILAIGPWDREYVLEAVRVSGITNTPIQVGDCGPRFSPVLGLGERYLPLKIGSFSFVAGAWILPRRSIFDSRNLQLLRMIWENRIRQMNPTVPFVLRVHMYQFAGIFTLDSLSPHAGRSELEFHLSVCKIPINIQEYKQALMKMLLDDLRQKEDLQTRVHREEYMFSGTSNIPSLEELLECQKTVIDVTSNEQGVYINSSENFSDIYKIVSLPSAIFKKDNFPCQFSSQVKVENDNIPNFNREIPIYKLESKSGDRYHTSISSTLTERYHALFRLDCQRVGRLLIPKDLPPSVLKKGSLESIRYEGWHTLFQISFLSKESMVESIHNAISQPWEILSHDIDMYKRHYTQNLEMELKWKILEALCLSVPESGIDPSCHLIGISVVTPLHTEWSDDKVGKWLKDSKESSVPINIYSKTIKKKTLIRARFNGVAVICCLPEPSIAALILQESAFGHNINFPTLESLIRKKGLSYRIVQSLCNSNGELYIYWGIQCLPEVNSVFTNTVKEWLESVEYYADQIEEWFNQMWVPLHPTRHRSIFQLMRDIDRMGNYTQPGFSFDGKLKTYVNLIRNEQLIDVSFINTF